MAEEGTYQAEEGALSLARSDWQNAIAANRRAVELLPTWSPPRNSLALGLFLDGYPDEAIAQAQAVVGKDPGNVQALSNLVRFLVLAGRAGEARSVWERLWRMPLPKKDEVNRLWVAEAAALLQEDAVVYKLLRPLFPRNLSSWEPSAREQLHPLGVLATAAANLGRRKEAAGCWEVLAADPAYENETHVCLEALSAGRPGPGWSERYPYAPPATLVFRTVMEEAGELIDGEEEMPEEEFRRRGDDLARRYPQLVVVAEALIWDYRSPHVGIPILRALGTPPAQAALRRYGTSQAGPDADREWALAVLAEIGGLAPGETVRAWLGGEWREVLPQPGRRDAEEEWPYAPELHDLMDQAVEAGHKGAYRQAEQLYRQILAHDPTVKEAYNNLAGLYAQQRDVVQTREMLQRALELDPLYAFPRGNMALLCLEEGDIAGAREWLAPLAGRSALPSEEMLFYQFVQARILLAEGKVEEAQDLLAAVLAKDPEYEPALNLQFALLARPALESIQQALAGLIEEQRKIARRHRERVCRQLTTPDPSLEQVLAAYGKGSLESMAESVLPGFKTSGLRKAELAAALQRALLEPDNLARIVAKLKKRERAALRAVLESGGGMADQTFRQRYGDNPGESLRWRYSRPASLLGRLRQRGLLAEGWVHEEECVLVAVELRPLLRELLRK